MTTTRPSPHSTEGITETEATREEVQAARRHLADGVREKAKQVPELGRRHPRATAAVGGAVALGVGAAAWMAGRRK